MDYSSRDLATMLRARFSIEAGEEISTEDAMVLIEKKHEELCAKQISDAEAKGISVVSEEEFDKEYDELLQYLENS